MPTHRLVAEVEVLGRPVGRNTETARNHVRFLIICSGFGIDNFSVIFVDEVRSVDFGRCTACYTPREPHPLTCEFGQRLLLVLLADIVLLNGNFCGRLWLKL